MKSKGYAKNLLSKKEKRNEKLLKKILLLSGIFLLSIVMLGQLALAEKNANNNPTELELLIKEVIVNFDVGGDTLTIKGVNFDNGAPPTVTLGEDPNPLYVVSYSAYEIEVNCPATTCSDGDYLLTVTTGPAVKDYDGYNLTIGAVGPKGEKGDTGDKGDKGDTGVPGNLALAGQICPGTTVLKGFDVNGDIVCVDVAAPPIYQIGDDGPAGGIVFHITDGGLHGLEAAPADHQSNATWGCYGTAITGADGTAVGTGAQNTSDIIAGCSELGIAAKIADAYTLGGYDDWYLPSKDELNLLYLQKAVVGGFAYGSYWSSTEVDSYFAWYQHFPSGYQGYDNKNVGSFRVRAVRAF